MTAPCRSMCITGSSRFPAALTGSCFRPRRWSSTWLRPIPARCNGVVRRRASDSRARGGPDRVRIDVPPQSTHGDSDVPANFDVADSLLEDASGDEALLDVEQLGSLALCEEHLHVREGELFVLVAVGHGGPPR